MKNNYMKNIICIFSKPPIAGMTKSRLAQSIGKIPAADLAAAMLQDILEQAIEVKNAEIFIAYPPENRPSEFNLPQYPNIKFIQQKGINLGERMANAFADLLSGKNSEKVIIIGSDCITVSSEKLQAGFTALSEYPIIIEPAQDGGYVLVGQSVFCPTMFRNINWGTNTVMNETRKKLNEANVNFSELPPSFDIDHYADLAKLKIFLQKNSRPHTKQSLLSITGQD
jgi:uncharacterized protein